MTKEDLKKMVESFILVLSPGSKVEVDEKDGWKVKISSPDSGNLIGKNGETLKTIQYLLKLMLTKKSGENMPLFVDVAGYREKKQWELEELALSIAENVKKSGYPQELRPMNAFERRVVHAVLNDFEGVKTGSIGEGELRRVKVEKAE